MRRLVPVCATLISVCLLQTACSIFSPVPLWELTKATGVVASNAIAFGPSTATRTVFHPHPSFHRLCIEFNPASQSAELVPVLQAELLRNSVESRVYENGAPADLCEIWLRYRAYNEWDIPPMSSSHRLYLYSASLVLQTKNGLVLSTSHYELDSVLGIGKWADMRSKLSPVISALLNGVENPGPVRTSLSQD